MGHHRHPKQVEQPVNDKPDRYRTGEFFIGPSKVLTDKRLTPKAKLVLLYLLSKPKDWVTQIQDIVNQSDIGKRAVQSALQELKKYGYARMVMGRRKNGEITGLTWEVSYRSGHFTNDAVLHPIQNVSDTKRDTTYMEEKEKKRKTTQTDSEKNFTRTKYGDRREMVHCDEEEFLEVKRAMGWDV